VKVRESHIDISVVIPLYNEEENVQPLYDILDEVLSGLGKEYEIIFIDDGSSDETYPRLKAIAQRDAHVKVIKFRNNCGQSAATDAGFELAAGDVIIVMDGDLQNDPRDIPKLLEKLEEGYDLVSGWRKNRKDKLLLRKVPSRIANRIICSVTKVNLHDTGCALKAYRKDVVKRINLYGELHRFLPALARIEGARITEIPVNHHPRKYGRSKYGITRTFKVIMDLLSLNLFIKYLKKPLHFFGKIALAFLFMAFLAIVGVFQGMLRGVYGPEEMNVLISIALVFTAGGLQFIFLGLIANLIFITGRKRKLYLANIKE
jgi:glycosyltransferase involved in cell wall biosynthesis